MAALELVSSFATAPGAGLAFAAVPTNSLTFRDSRDPIWMLELWQHRQVAGFTRVTSPLLHDAVVGIQGRGGIGHSRLYRGWDQRVYPQDTLAVIGSGGGAGIVEYVHWLAYYESLPGITSNLITYEELERRGEDVYTFTATLNTSTAGVYTGSELVTAEQDQFKANTEYAWLGSTWQVAPGVAAIRMLGPDFGNVGIGMPTMDDATQGSNQGWNTGRFWSDLSRELGAALIPVINSANKSLTTIDCLVDNVVGDPVGVIVMVRLAPKATARKRK